jgi:hypothetical protein
MSSTAMRVTAGATVRDDVAAQPAGFDLHAKDPVAVVGEQIVALILTERNRYEIALLHEGGQHDRFRSISAARGMRTALPYLSALLPARDERDFTALARVLARRPAAPSARLLGPNVMRDTALPG